MLLWFDDKDQKIKSLPKLTWCQGSVFTVKHRCLLFMRDSNFHFLIANMKSCDLTWHADILYSMGRRLQTLEYVHLHCLCPHSSISTACSVFPSSHKCLKRVDMEKYYLSGLTRVHHPQVLMCWVNCSLLVRETGKLGWRWCGIGLNARIWDPWDFPGLGNQDF